MIGRLGTLALSAGVVASVTAALLWLRAAVLGGSPRSARQATWAVLAAAAAACLALERALVGHDFSVRYVAENGGRAVPLLYEVTALWSALEGSLLLWLLVLGTYAVLLAQRVDGSTVDRWAMAAVSVVGVFFFALALFGGNPFTPVRPVPADGPGPNPLLAEHPAMLVHPPLLYAGYVGLAVPFGYAVAALVTGRADARWLAATRRWTLIAWCCLTAGIALGAWWSYAVLGWGGYWAWDPVENASLMPWLTATALLHTTLPGRRRPAVPGWTVCLAGASFLLVLTGTFLTRSGAVQSVHAFTESLLGPMLLGFVLAATAVVGGLLLWRADRLGGAGLAGRMLSRGGAVLANSLVLVTLTTVVLTGTVLPVVVRALDGAQLSVGPPYFDRAALPAVLVLLLLMGAAPYVRRAGDDAGTLASRLAVPAAAGLGTVAVVGSLSRPGPAALTALGAAAFVLAGVLRQAVLDLRSARAPGRWLRRRRRWLGGMLAHAGIAVVAVGVAGSAYAVVTEGSLAVGRTMTAGDATVRLSDVDRSADAAAMSAAARLVLERDGRPIGVLTPQLRHYTARDQTVAIPAIRSRPTGDVYATVTSVDAAGTTATVRLAVNPLVGFVWLGAGLTVAGGLLALGRGRLRPVAAEAGGTPDEEPAPSIRSEVDPSIRSEVDTALTAASDDSAGRSA